METYPTGLIVIQFNPFHGKGGKFSSAGGAVKKAVKNTTEAIAIRGDRHERSQTREEMRNTRGTLLSLRGHIRPNEETAIHHVEMAVHHEEKEDLPKANRLYREAYKASLAPDVHPDLRDLIKVHTRHGLRRTGYSPNG